MPVAYFLCKIFISKIKVCLHLDYRILRQGRQRIRNSRCQFLVQFRQAVASQSHACAFLDAAR